MRSNENPDWLPEGWFVELKTYKSGASFGRRYKVLCSNLSAFSISGSSPWVHITLLSIVSFPFLTLMLVLLRHLIG